MSSKNNSRNMIKVAHTRKYKDKLMYYYTMTNNPTQKSIKNQNETKKTNNNLIFFTKTPKTSNPHINAT